MQPFNPRVSISSVRWNGVVEVGRRTKRLHIFAQRSDCPSDHVRPIRRSGREKGLGDDEDDIVWHRPRAYPRVLLLLGAALRVLLLTDPHLPPPTSAPPRVIHQSPSCRRCLHGPFFRRVSFGLFKAHQSGIRAVDRPPPLPEKPLPKLQPLPPPYRRRRRKRSRKGVGNLHSSPEKKEHRSSGTPAEHCADFSGAPSPRQRDVIITSSAHSTVTATSATGPATSSEGPLATSSEGPTFSGTHI
ncbi:hypothetical protein ACLOJK_031904 [Asimina triloba]